MHARLWVKEIEKLEEAKLRDLVIGGGNDILLDSCSEYASIYLFLCVCVFVILLFGVETLDFLY